MSGDVQPRKRKDKKKKKDEAVLLPPREEPTVTAIPVHTINPSDELIHVHKESRLGGNICAKIVFFILLGTIAVAVGLIITEYKGSGDVASPADSPWSQALEGWVDDGGDKHDDDHDIHPIASEEEHEDDDDHDHIPDHSEEEGSHEEEEEEIVPRRSTQTESQVSGDEHEEGSQEGAEDEGDQNDGSQEIDHAEEEEEQGFLGMAIQGLFGGASGSPIDGEEDSPNSAEVEDQGDEDDREETDDEEQPGAAGSSDENEQEFTENEDDNENDDDRNEAHSTENEDDNEDNEAAVDENMNSNEDEHNKDDDSTENFEGSNEEESEPDREDDDGNKSEETVDSNEVPLNAEPDNGDSNEENGSENKDEDVDENNNIKNEDVSEENTQFYGRGDLEEDENTSDDDQGDDGDDFVEERHELGDAPFPDAGLDDLAGEPDEFEEIQEQPEPGNKSPEEDAGLDPVGIALKFGVGIAIIIVAHMVLVKNWNRSESGAATLDPSAATDGGDSPIIVPRRQTLIPSSAQLGTAPPDEEDPEDYDFSNEEEEEEEHPEPERIVPVLGMYGALCQDDSEEEEENVEDEEEVEEEENPEEEFDKNYGYSYKAAPPQNRQQEEVEESDDVEDEEELLEEEEVEEEEEEEEYDGSSWPRERGDQRSDDKHSEGEEASEDERALPPRTPPASRSGGPQESNQPDGVPNQEPPPLSVVPRTEEDRVLEEARAQMDENPEIALKVLDSFTSDQKKRASARVAVLRARTLDNLAQKKRSNKLLEQVIETYLEVLSLPDIENDEFVKIADRCIDRMRFRGYHHKAPEIHQKVIEKFPNDPSAKNQLAVTYLMINSVGKAKNVLEEVLARWPENGFARVHYGFILKTSENNVSEGVRHLQAGIDSKEPGTMDARFLFHLGDGLNRLGRPEEALKVYELGVKEGLFRSKFQRSLYNVDTLKAKPWWTIEETTYEDLLRKLEQNWEAIRDEGLAILHSQSETGPFKDEAENLRDVGDWKQLELYARGRRLNSNCARAPITCGLIASFPAARDCRRGQVKFSVMHPGTHVWPHCGPTNCRLRSHLGLVVPPGAAIRVADETRTWKEGKIMVFDDSFEHEVWHNGTSFRLVLIVDFWHPELTELEKRSLPAI